MSEPDAMDLDNIGREIAREFTEYDAEWQTVLSTFASSWSNGRFAGGGRADAERLMRVLERLGFTITKEDPCV